MDKIAECVPGPDIIGLRSSEAANAMAAKNSIADRSECPFSSATGNDARQQEDYGAREKNKRRIKSFLAQQVNEKTDERAYVNLNKT